MKRLCVTFGQVHVHNVNGITFDKDCVAVIQAHTIEQADRWAFEWFDGKFHQHTDWDKFNHDSMRYYPRGYITVNGPLEPTYVGDQVDPPA